ncbi:MAG: methyltransferase domain-containing protein [Schlesneria sp.]
MKWMANWVMSRRSQKLLARLFHCLPESGNIADVGSGTGHNADAVRRLGKHHVREFDVADLHWVGPGPELINNSKIPAEDRVFDGLIMFFVLQYPLSPEELLRECRRVSRGPLLIIQSTYQGRLGRFLLSIREFFWGRFALRLAIMAGLVRPGHCSLQTRRDFTRLELTELFTRTGLEVVEVVPRNWSRLGVSRDLFVLRREGL